MVVEARDMILVVPRVMLSLDAFMCKAYKINTKSLLGNWKPKDQKRQDEMKMRGIELERFLHASELYTTKNCSCEKHC